MEQVNRYLRLYYYVCSPSYSPFNPLARSWTSRNIKLIREHYGLLSQIGLVFYQCSVTETYWKLQVKLGTYGWERMNHQLLILFTQMPMKYLKYLPNFLIFIYLSKYLLTYREMAIWRFVYIFHKSCLRALTKPKLKPTKQIPKHTKTKTTKTKKKVLLTISLDV